MIEKSEGIASLAKALATAQGKFPAAKFDATNKFLNNKYASLGSIIEAAKPILAENGLSVSQLMIGAGDHIGVTTVLLHSSGEWIESTVMLPVNEEKGKSAAQAAGSVITYLRRYALTSILGIYADDDTDGQQQKQEKKTETKVEPSNDKPAYTPEQIYQAVADAGLVENIHAARQMLNWCKTGYSTPEEAVAWATDFRTFRKPDKSVTVKEAADLANEKHKK